MRKTADIGKFYYFFPQTVAMVGVKENIMPAAWHTPISADPPLYGVLLSPKRHTFQLLKEGDGFTANFLGFDFAALVAKTGGVSGRDINKFDKFKIKHSPAEHINGPILQESYAAYECEKYAIHEYGDHFLCIGKIVMIHHRDDIINDQLVDEKKVSPMLYFGKDRYITIDPSTLSVFKRG